MALLWNNCHRTSTSNHWSELDRTTRNANGCRNGVGHPDACGVDVLMGQARCLLSSVYSIRGTTEFIYSRIQMANARHMVCSLWYRDLSVCLVFYVSGCSG